MLDKATVGIAQWLPVTGQADENLATALEFISTLGAQGCDLIVLPELWPSGFSRNTFVDDARSCAEPIDGPRTRALSKAARSAGAWLAGGSMPERAGNQIFNTAVLFSRDGVMRASHRKAHLFAPLDEDKAVTAGDRLTTCRTGDFGEIGLTICFDGDFPEVARTLGARGARVVIQMSAYELEAEAWWDCLYPANALANGQWWIMANQCGTNPSETIIGASQIISPFGKVVAQARRAKAGENPPFELLVATINLREELERADRELAALWQLRRPELYEIGQESRVLKVS